MSSLLRTSEYTGMGYTIIDGDTYEYYYVVKDFLIDHSKPFIYNKIKDNSSHKLLS